MSYNFAVILDEQVFTKTLMDFKRLVEDQSGDRDIWYDAIYAVKDSELVMVSAEFVPGSSAYVYDEQGYRTDQYCTYEMTDKDGNTYGQFTARFDLRS